MKSVLKKDNFPDQVENGNVTWTGAVTMNTFAGILHQLGPGAMAMATNQGYITQTTLDNWIATHNNNGGGGGG